MYLYLTKTGVIRLKRLVIIKRTGILKLVELFKPVLSFAHLFTPVHTCPDLSEHFVPPYLNHSISSKRLGVWSDCFVAFISLYFSLRKVQFHQSALLYVAMATMHLCSLFLKTQIAIVFQVFPPERNFLWDNLLCFGHHNTLRSLIIANIRSVTVETFQKLFCPNMVIDTKTT